jgi:DNA-binding transcriptional regulator YiaG
MKSTTTKENFMRKTDREVWDAIDQAVFGTSNQDVIRKKIKEELAEHKRLEETLGGFLFLLREGMEVTVPTIAAKAKVTVEQWERWEGEVSIPTGAELTKLIEDLGLYKLNANKLISLWHQAAFRSLCQSLKFKPQLLAARGVAAVNAESQWELLHPEARKRLAFWAEQRGLSLPAQLFDLLESLDLKTEEEQEDWAREVWNSRE